LRSDPFSAARFVTSIKTISRSSRFSIAGFSVRTGKKMNTPDNRGKRDATTIGFKIDFALEARILRHGVTHGYRSIGALARMLIEQGLNAPPNPQPLEVQSQPSTRKDPRGRNKVSDKTFSLRISRELSERITGFCEREGLATKSAAVRELLHRALR
jgi:hypothetical protein